MPSKTLIWTGAEWSGFGAEPVEPLAHTAGAFAPASLDYTPPTINVRYVSPTGSDSAAGTASAPMKSVAVAAEQIKSSGTADNPATVVLRAGSYPLNDYQPGNGHALRFQAYPGEEVWFDGSEEFTGSWTNNGNGTYSIDYTAPPIPSLGTDHTQGDANALLPDMCFVDGLALYQRADNQTPTAGQFSVNRGTNRLTVATNPAGREIRYAATQRLIFSGSRIDLLGIGARRYRCAGGTANAAIYYGGTAAGTIIENCRFVQMGRSVLAVTKDDMRVSDCTFTEVGQTAVGGDRCDNLVIENSRFFNLNTGKWKPQPTSGAIKITAARNVKVRHNHMKHCHNGVMIWMDVSVTQFKCYGNYVDGTSFDGSTYADTGIDYEECDGGFWDGVQHESLIVGNTVINCHKAVAIVAAGAVLLAHNTISAKWTGNQQQALVVVQDRDDNHGLQVPRENCRWITRWIRLVNNRIKPQSGGWQFLAYDSQGEVSKPRSLAISAGFGDTDLAQFIGGNMLTQVESNWFAPATGSANSGSIMATIGEANGVRQNYNTPAALQTTSPAHGLSTSNIKTNYQSAADPTGEDHDTAVPMELAVAALLGVPAGTRWIGNPIPEPATP